MTRFKRWLTADNDEHIYWRLYKAFVICFGILLLLAIGAIMLSSCSYSITVRVEQPDDSIPVAIQPNDTRASQASARIGIRSM